MTHVRQVRYWLTLRKPRLPSCGQRTSRRPIAPKPAVLRIEPPTLTATIFAVAVVGCSMTVPKERREPAARAWIDLRLL